MANTRKIIMTGLFAACALAVNLAEGILPMPFPGVKLGLANIFALAALILFGVRTAFAVTLLRVFLAWLLSGNIFAFVCSACGAIPSVAVMTLLYKRDDRNGEIFSVPWISVAGAWAFNIGQVAAVTFMLNDLRVAFYLLPLFAVGSAAGWAVGRTAEILADRLRKIM